MNKQKIYELIHPLRTTTWKRSKRFPEINEQNYKTYYEIACRTYLRNHDTRYQRVDSVKQIIKYETPEFQGRRYWTGTLKAITYRTNRIEENIEHFLQICENKKIVNFLWEVYNWKDYQTLGYVKAHSSEEAEQLSKMMFSHVIKAINGNLSYKQLQPLWSFEKEQSKEIYTSFCLRADQNVSEIITGRKEQIKRLEEEIKNYHLVKDFINLNMSTFEG